MPKRSRRAELIRAVREGTLDLKALAQLSDEDRAFAELLMQYPVAGRDRLIDAPDAVIARAAAIPAGKKGRLTDLLPKLVFDSWAQPLAAGVRGAATTDDRRLRYEFGPIVLDIRGEKDPDGWFLTARVSQTDTPRNWTLKVGRQEVGSNDQGFYEWHSPRAPQSLELLSDDGEQVKLPKLVWTRKA